MTNKFKIFLAGFIAHSAGTSLYQDLLGKERYLKLVDVGWIDSGFTVPLAMLMLVLSIIVYYSER